MANLETVERGHGRIAPLDPLLGDALRLSCSLAEALTPVDNMHWWDYTSRPTWLHYITYYITYYYLVCSAVRILKTSPTRSYFVLKIRCISPIRLIETESETQSINPYAFCVHISIIVCKYDWVYVCSACVHQGTWHSAFQESLTLRALNKPTGLCDLDQRDDDWIDTKSTLESDDASVE